MAAIWHAGWHEAHSGHVPAGLTAARTPVSFRERAADLVPCTVVAVDEREMAGFVTVVDDEVEQLFVAVDHRGTGLATRLLTTGEERVAHGGYDAAWLAVVAGNARARRFYERQGWSDAGDLPYEVTAGGSTYVSPCRRYEKVVSDLLT